MNKIIYKGVTLKVYITCRLMNVFSQQFFVFMADDKYVYGLWKEATVNDNRTFSLRLKQ